MTILGAAVSLGDLLAIAALAINAIAWFVNYGYQKRRWEQTEKDVDNIQQQNLLIKREFDASKDKIAKQREEDIAALRVQAMADKSEIESAIAHAADKIEMTYARKDLLEQLIANMVQQVSFIAQQVTEIRTEQRERALRDAAILRTRSTDPP